MPEDKEISEKETVNVVVEQAVTPLDRWIPKTDIGKKVKSGEITNIDQILDKGLRILEPEIVDILLPNLETELIAVGQSKGKFGGGKRNIWRQTQKKTKEGNKPKFTAVVAAGNKNGYVGIGRGKAKETVPAREKAIRDAKLNIIKILRGCGSWESRAREPNSIPFNIRGKCGSVILNLKTAPKGVGLVVEKEIAKILRLAGVQDIRSKTHGQTRTKINLAYACFDALKKLSAMKIKSEYIERLGIVYGSR